MKKQIVVFLATALAVVLFASSALAWRSVRTGQKNFERAWSAYLFKQPDKAQGYFVKAADAFAEALAETPPSRTTMFASNLAMAGISLYHAGRYQECIDAMAKAMTKDGRMWEAPLYTALSHARLGEAAKTVESLKAYLKTSPTQAILSEEVNRQLTNLETGSGSLDGAADAVDAAAFDQFSNNETFTGPNASNGNERCDGVYWWRNNKSPCSQSLFVDK